MPAALHPAHEALAGAKLIWLESPSNPGLEVCDIRALVKGARKLRPGEPPTAESAQTLLENLFFNHKRYDLAKVGRYKIAKKLGEASDVTRRQLKAKFDAMKEKIMSQRLNLVLSSLMTPRAWERLA